MKTAEEMYNYCVENGYGSGMTRNWGIKHFKVIEENLRSDEEVYMTFIGLKDFVSITNHDNNYAYAITNKRMMFGQKKLMGQNFVSVVFDRINDISSSTGMAMGTVTIDTLGETFNVGVDKATANNISKEAHNIIFDMRSDKEIKAENSTDNVIEEIRKFKELMDEGIITEEEFNIKKKLLLGI